LSATKKFEEKSIERGIQRQRTSSCIVALVVGVLDELRTLRHRRCDKVQAFQIRTIAFTAGATFALQPLKQTSELALAQDSICLQVGELLGERLAESTTTFVRCEVNDLTVGNKPGARDYTGSEYLGSARIPQAPVLYHFAAVTGFDELLQ